MEAALLPPFFESTILFSSHTKFEKNTKKEIWLCHEYMGLSMNDIYNMPIMDRKSFIAIHNKELEKQKEKLKVKKRRKGK